MARDGKVTARKPRKLRKARGQALHLGVPKGSLQDATVRLFELAGYNLSVAPRSYFPDIDDPEISCMLIRAQEMARYVQQGVLDCGITGTDWVQECRAKVVEVADLEAPAWPRYRKVRWLLAVNERSAVRRVQDLAGLRIATEAVGITRRYLRRNGVKAEVEFSWGATEVKPPVLADAIVDVSDTGRSLRANGLRIVDTVLESTPRLIVNREAYADPWKRRKVERLALMLRGAINAAGRVGLMMNVRRRDLDAVLGVLPALGTPTIASLADENWVAVNTVVEETVVRDLLPELVEKGATGVVEYPLAKIVG